MLWYSLSQISFGLGNYYFIINCLNLFYLLNFSHSNIIERYKTIGNLNLLITQNDQVIVLQPGNEMSNDLPYDHFFSCFKDTGNF